MVKLTFTFLLMVGHIFAIVSCDMGIVHKFGQLICKQNGDQYISASCKGLNADNILVFCNSGGRPNEVISACPKGFDCRYSTEEKDVDCVKAD